MDDNDAQETRKSDISLYNIDLHHTPYTNLYYRATEEVSHMNPLDSTNKYYGRSKSYTDLYRRATEEVAGEVIEVMVKEDEIKEAIGDKQELSINVPVPKLQRHFDAIAKRKQLSEAEMISLAQELCVLATYKQQRTVIVENCRFSVGLSVGADAVSVSFYLKKVKRKDKKKTTWLKFISKSLVIPGDEDASIANFTLNGGWEIIDKDVRADYLRLLTPARILVREQLGVSEIEALDDIEYFKEMAETLDD